MGVGVPHPAANVTYGAPRGDEDRVAPLAVFATFDPGGTRVTSITSCWDLSDAEIDEIARTKQVMMNVMGGGLPPHYIAPASAMREFVTAFGETWHKPDTTKEETP